MDVFLKELSKIVAVISKYPAGCAVSAMIFLMSPLIFNPTISLDNYESLTIKIFGMAVPYICIPLGFFAAVAAPTFGAGLRKQWNARL